MASTPDGRIGQVFRDALGGIWSVQFANPPHTQASNMNMLRNFYGQQLRQSLAASSNTPPAPRVAPAELNDDPVAVAAWHALDRGATVWDAIESVGRIL